MPQASEAIKMSEGFYTSTFRTFKDVTSSGILGDATKANREWGKNMIEGAAKNITQAIEDFMKGHVAISRREPACTQYQNRKSLGPRTSRPLFVFQILSAGIPSSN